LFLCCQGCGAFGGYVPLKFLLQWLSASLAGRTLLYYPFGNPLASCIPFFAAELLLLPGPAVTVGELWRALRRTAREVWAPRKTSQVDSAEPKALFNDLLNAIKAQRKRQQ
jgi:hypothetical protein